MSRSRDLYQHIHQLEDIRGILNAMKNLALMAVHKLTQLQIWQSQMVAHVESNSARFLAGIRILSATITVKSFIWC